MARFTIFGSTGFIGRHLAAKLKAAGHDVLEVTRRNMPDSKENLGNAIYCVGLTADFRSRLPETLEAHVGELIRIIDLYQFESFLYLSSTRVYASADSGREDARLIVPESPIDGVYNLSKLAGEALCLAQASEKIRVVRLSNVIGCGASPKEFLPSLIAEARAMRKVSLRSLPSFSKDYVDIDDACEMLRLISLGGRERLYNVAAGVDTSNATIAELLKTHLNVETSYGVDAGTLVFPPINVERIQCEFGFVPRPFEVTFEMMI